MSSSQTGRGRRAPRLPQGSQNQQVRVVRKEEEPVVLLSFRQRFEAGRSFDLDDDLEFCPNLITDLDMFSLSSASDQSSFSSESPESSPQAHQASPSYHVNSNTPPYLPISYQYQTSKSKYDQPTSRRNAIVIVNPNTNNDSLTCIHGRSTQSIGRRW